MTAESAARTALITGATSGIGAAFARRYAREGFNVVMHGRRRDRLEAAAKEIRSSCGVRADVLIADLSDPVDVARVADVVASDERLEVLVNNAGFTPLKPFEATDLEDIESMIAVHVAALTRLTRSALPGMLRRHSGTIINVASDGIFVRYPRSLMATYAASKAYVDTFTRSIATVAGESNVRVQVLCPGFVTSDILERHGITFADWGIPDSAVMPADVCVDASLRALQLGEVVCVPTLQDETLLDRLESIENEIRLQSSGNSRPGARYDVRRDVSQVRTKQT